MPQVSSGSPTSSLTALGQVALVSMPQGPDWFMIDVSGTWTGTLTFETSKDGVNWDSTTLTFTPYPTGTAVTTATGNGRWFAMAGGQLYCRARMSAFTSGTAVVQAVAFTGPMWLTQVSSAATQQTITIACASQRSVKIRSGYISYSGAAPTTANVQFQDGQSGQLTTFWKEDFALTQTAVAFNLPADLNQQGLQSASPAGWPASLGGLQFLQGSSVVVTVPNSGASVVTRIGLEVWAVP